MNVSVVGSGYVGLVTAACFAEKGHKITCVDIDPQKIDKINNKIPPIYEEGLAEILESVVPHNLNATDDLLEAINSSQATFICVGTPCAADGQIDLTHIKKVSEQIGKILADKKNYHVVVVKSTVIPGTTQDHVIPLLESASGKTAGKDFGVVMNPEFLREGKAIIDFKKPDRVVIGSIDDESADLVEKLYYHFKAPVLRVDLKTAEMIKYTANSLLATKVSFINEVGNVCKKIGVNVYDVAQGIGLDHRISPHFLSAGPGFGGSCFPKDVSALIYKAGEVGVQPILLNAVLEVNRNQPEKVLELIEKQHEIKDSKIAVLGLAFKAGTDDVRQSPSIPIIEGLLDLGAVIQAHDFEALDATKKIFKDKITYHSEIKDALAGAELALILTEWPQYKKMDFTPMKEKKIFDTRYIINQDLLPEDVEYEGLCW
ncbi:MAG: nucleotide sugar dehydrogenase [Candidatus Altiarchaeales archaeon]|nr:nucleotide sugar dehydrogenase [Candidatus Altiarchaeales archaeon]